MSNKADKSVLCSLQLKRLTKGNTLLELLNDNEFQVQQRAQAIHETIDQLHEKAEEKRNMTAYIESRLSHPFTIMEMVENYLEANKNTITHNELSSIRNLMFLMTSEHHSYTNDVVSRVIATQNACKEN
jgi:hypothetical protein